MKTVQALIDRGLVFWTSTGRGDHHTGIALTELGAQTLEPPAKPYVR